MTSLVISNLKVWWLSAVMYNLFVITFRIYLALLGSRVCSLATDNGRLCGESQRLYQEKERLQIKVSVLPVCCCCCRSYFVCCCYNFVYALSWVTVCALLVVESFYWDKALVDERDVKRLNYNLFRLSLQDKCWSRIPFPSQRRGMYLLHGLTQYHMKVLVFSVAFIWIVTH